MLCGATISGVVVAVSYILKEFQENKDKIEIYLAFGATRMEACRPLAVQALKLALTPPINSMRFVLSSLFKILSSCLSTVSLE
jgi:ABC-type iron transport system FetAB permease component